MAFVHLHTHSHYSFLQALPKIDELVKAAKKQGMPALALTDAGNVHGAIELYKGAKKAGMKPIIGVDAYVAQRSRFDRERDEKRSRLVLLAENMAGYKNLLVLITASFTEGFHERPRIDKELLKKHHEGLIAIIPSFSGDVVQMITLGDPDTAAALLEEHVSIFGKDNVFLEVTHHPKVEGHTKRMKALIELGKKGGVPVVAQQDVYYLAPEDAQACSVLRRIQHGERGHNESEDFSFVSEEQMLSFFKETPEFVHRSGEIAERCTIEFTLGSWVFPNFSVPKGQTHPDVLRERTYAGISARGLEDNPALRERIEYELKIIIEKGFAPYFLVVSDLLTFARNSGILATTRGSAAGSLVSYLTGITNVDPLFYKLPFERFLNPERPKAPDIDMDFADNRRDEVIAYARKKYGEDHVAQIGTFGTMLARAAVRDVARALGHSYGTGDRIAKLIPLGSQGFPMTIDRALQLEEELQSMYNEDDDVREIIDLAKRIEGCARQTGVHAAGVVIAPTPLVEWTALQTDPKTGKLITQYDMHAIEDAGLLKFDFLGIKNLAVLADAVDRVHKSRGIVIDIETVPLDDQATFAMLARGETEGTFQLNGSGMTRYLKELRPTTIHDINAMVALYRPGPMETIPQYIERKRNPRLVRFLDDRMEEYLGASYGLLVYQDDVLLTAVKLGGYSWLEADALRKAMGKKIPEEMEAQKEKLIEGFKEHGKLSQEKAETLWKLIEPFAAYGFNKCLTGDARIYNPKTGALQQIKDLMHEQEEPTVSSLTNEGKLIATQARWVRENGIKKVYRLTTRSGRVLRATANHPLLSWEGWRALGTFMPGERIAVPRRLPTPLHAQFVPSHEAAVLGYLLSEGNLCHPHGIYFYSTQKNEVEDFVHAALCFSNVQVTLDRSKSATSVYVGKKDRGSENAMVTWASLLGIRGKRATEKSIPSQVFEWNNQALEMLLGKLWQGDGAVSLANMQSFYATSSEQLAQDIRHLLLRFGILSTIHNKRFKYRGGIRLGWTVVITGTQNLARFYETAGQHLIGSKQSSLALLVRETGRRTNNRGRGTSDTIPVAVLVEIRAEAGKCNMSLADLAKKAQVSSRLFSLDERKRGYTRETVSKTAVALASKTLTQYAESDIYWDEIRSVESDGEEMTYDLSVPGIENFIANDMIVHNSHAASYGKVAYQTAYMKAHYPPEYMAALLSADAGDTEKIAILVAECVRLKIPVLPPDINESGSTFTVVGEENDTIRFGLSSIKNFGEGISEAIMHEREANGSFASLSDFLSRIGSRNLNKKSLEALIKCGALDRFAPEENGRLRLLEQVEVLLAFHRDATVAAPQDTLFVTKAPLLVLPESTTVLPLGEKLSWEHELLGIYVSGHPLDAHTSTSAKASVSIGEIKSDPHAGLPVILPVLVSETRVILTKSGEKMAFIKLTDKTGDIEAVVFPRLYKERGDAVTAGACLLVKGTVSKRNGELSLALENLKPI